MTIQPQTPITDADEARFWSKVDKNGKAPKHVPHLGKCWNWTGAVSSRDNPYGQFWLNGKHQRSPRVAFRISFGEFAKHLCVLHKCDNPSCVNPSHLKVGTHKENTQDSILRKRNVKFTQIGKHPLGESCNGAKLTPHKVIAIRNLNAKGSTYISLAIKFGVSESNIGGICRRQLWRHIK